MIKSEYNIIGVMSGTSLDGIDLIYATFVYHGTWDFTIAKAETIAYDISWKQKLSNLVNLSMEELNLLDDDYTGYLANIINDFIDENNIIEIDAICSHGHTALHQPDKKLTYQIGNKPKLAALLGHTVVCDFRVQDVDLGGQGAPLVPIGDKSLFSEYDFCINLGGFSNISYDVDNKRIAYDICPVNIVLNKYVDQLGLDYDDGGKIAASGAINNQLLNQLNVLPFYKASYPKSLGLEWVHQNIFALIDSFRLEIKDILRTFVEHIAIQITSEINSKKNATVLLTGGGVYNMFLINRIQDIENQKVIVPSNTVVEFKEALIFGFLGVLKLRNETNCLKSVTGATHDHSSGKIFRP
jgi:anhydro-N-acetylmuramic acid kinase